MNPAPKHSQAVIAIGLVLSAMFAFAVMDGLTKMLSQTLPIPQILWVRNIVFTAIAVALLRGQNRDRSLLSLARSARPKHAVRPCATAAARKRRLHGGI